MYSNSYSFYNNVYMANEKNKIDIFIAIFLGFVILFLTGYRNINMINSKNFIISLLIFIILSYFSVKAYKRYKYLAALMFLSIFLLSPNVFTNKQGELFPITYIIFSIYFSILLGNNLYIKWKSSL